MAAKVFSAMNARRTTMANDITRWGEMVLEAHRRIRSSVLETPVEDMTGLLTDPSVRVLFKMENLQETGSFKLRGATNKILTLTPEQAARGVIAASNGNHGLGVAAAARKSGIAAEVFVSGHVSPYKAKRIEQLGAHIRRAGDGPLDAELAGAKPRCNRARSSSLPTMTGK